MAVRGCRKLEGFHHLLMRMPMMKTTKSPSMAAVTLSPTTELAMWLRSFGFDLSPVFGRLAGFRQ
jgi:hypothetical protein